MVWYAIVAVRTAKPCFNVSAVQKLPAPELRRQCLSWESSGISRLTERFGTTVSMTCWQCAAPHSRLVCEDLCSRLEQV